MFSSFDSWSQTNVRLCVERTFFLPIFLENGSQINTHGMSVWLAMSALTAAYTRHGNQDRTNRPYRKAVEDYVNDWERAGQTLPKIKSLLVVKYGFLRTTPNEKKKNTTRKVTERMNTVT